MFSTARGHPARRGQRGRGGKVDGKRRDRKVKEGVQMEGSSIC